MMRGLIHRCKGYLLTQKGMPKKRLVKGQAVLINVEQLKWLVDNSPLKPEVYPDREVN